MRVEEWLGKDNRLGIDIWNKKYRYNNETFDEWLDRVSAGNTNIKKMIINKEFLFGGRVLSNRGVDKKATYSNCYVLSAPEDNLESIFQTCSNMARTFSYGGGVGFDISKLRPRGATVNNTAKQTSGAVSFMDLFSMVTGIIGQNGRRGALMLSMSVDHPDIMEFIDVKTDIERVTKANISIRVTDKFMKAVENNEDWKLTFTVEETGQKISKVVKARDILHKVAENNWNYGEPGVLFWDTISNNHLMSENDKFKYAGTNPSLRKGTKILTDDGVVPIEELQDKQFNVINLNGEISKAKCFLSGRNKPLWKIKLDNGEEYYATKEHKWAVRNNGNCCEKITTDKLKSGMELPTTPITSLPYGKMGSYEDGFLIGFLYGDGSITERKDGRTQYGFTFGKEKCDVGIKDKICEKLSQITDKEIHCFVRNRGGEDWVETSSSDVKLRDYMSNFGVKNKWELPNGFYTNLSEDFRKGFIDGLFSADGCVCGTKGNENIVLVNKSKNFVEEIRKYLMWYGIRSSMSIKKTNLLGKAYTSWSLKISKCSAWHFSKCFKLSHIKKQEKLKSIEEPQKRTEKLYFTKIKYVCKTNIKEDVWDITVFDTTHCFKLNGCITGNCGEMPLPEGGACNLGSLNLSAFVREPFTKKAYIDYDRLTVCVRNAIWALNDLLDEGLPRHPLAYQRVSVARWRQIGLGYMGLADMLIKLGIEYGSTEAVKIVDDVLSHCAKIALMFSESYAIAKGIELRVDFNKIKESDFYRRLGKSVDALANSQLLTIAPTGSLSTMLGISGGIEPIFANSYTRKTESLNGEDTYYKVYTPIVKEYMELTGITNDEDLPNYFVTAHEIDYEKRIDMQATAQKWIDGAISSTINLPNSATVEDVENAYKYAWKKCCKGVTVFRDGCARSGVLITNEPKEKPTETKDHELIGLKRKIVTGCGNLHINAYFDKATGELKETFLSKGSCGGCNNFMIGLSRMLSLACRNGATTEDVVDQLKSSGVCPSYAVRKATKNDTSKGSCCPVAIGYALLDMQSEIDTGNFTKDIDTTPKQDVCPDCGEPLEHEGGCDICKACGYSKCS